ncbi:MAG: YcgJ family protein [Cyanobacteriota bacterium]
MAVRTHHRLDLRSHRVTPHRSTLLKLTIGVALGVGLLGSGLAAVAQGAGISSPQQGVICDGSGQVCYDAQGLSLGLTRTYFGAFAEQNALRNLSGQPAPRQFRLSSGAACDVNQRLCWSDGWSQRVVDRTLSGQLFGNGGGGPNKPSGTATGLCRLTQGFRTIFNGQCELKEVSNDRRRRFVVNLGNGVRYSFEDRGSGYRISDGMGGSWPVTFNDQGRSAVFRWADRSLSVTQNAYQGGSAVGRALGSLLEALFN